MLCRAGQGRVGGFMWVKDGFALACGFGADSDGLGSVHGY